MKPLTMTSLLIIAGLLMVHSLVWTPTIWGQVQRSVFDGEWVINYTDCNGVTTIYEDCKVTDIDDVWLTFTCAGRSSEIKLSLTSVCATIVMERER